MADALTTTTTAAYGMNALISAKAVQYYDKQRVFAGLIGEEHKYLVPAGAKSIEVDQLDYLTMTASDTSPGEAVADDSETFATTPRTLTPAVVSTNILTSWIKQDNTTGYADQIAEAAGYAYAVAQDSAANISFASLYTEATGTTHELGANSTALTAALGRAGWAALLSSGARGPYNWVIDPIQANELMADAEFRQSVMKVNGDGSYAVTTGVNMDRYLGTIYGVNVWVGNGMVESTGLFSMMFGRGALGLGYKMVSTDVAPTPTELSIGAQWSNDLRAYRTLVMACFDASGIAFTSTTNSFLVALVS